MFYLVVIVALLALALIYLIWRERKGEGDTVSEKEAEDQETEHFSASVSTVPKTLPSSKARTPAPARPSASFSQADTELVAVLRQLLVSSNATTKFERLVAPLVADNETVATVMQQLLRLRQMLALPNVRIAPPDIDYAANRVVENACNTLHTALVRDTQAVAKNTNKVETLVLLQELGLAPLVPLPTVATFNAGAVETLHKSMPWTVAAVYVQEAASFLTVFGAFGWMTGGSEYVGPLLPAVPVNRKPYVHVQTAQTVLMVLAPDALDNLLPFQAQRRTQDVHPLYGRLGLLPSVLQQKTETETDTAETETYVSPNMGLDMMVATLMAHWSRTAESESEIETESTIAPIIARKLAMQLHTTDATIETALAIARSTFKAVKANASADIQTILRHNASEMRVHGIQSAFTHLS